MMAKTRLIGAGTLAALAIAGGITLAAAPQGRVPLEASGDDLAPLLAAITGYQIPSFGPYNVTAALTFGPAGVAIEDLALDAGPPDARFSLTGAVRNLRSNPTYDLRLTANGADLAAYAPLLGAGLPQTPPLDLDVRMARQTGPIELSDLVLRLGNSRITGNLTVNPAVRPANIAGALRAPLLDLAELAADPTASPGTGSRPALPAGWLRAAQGNVSVHADRVVLPDQTLRNTDVDLELRDGALTAHPFALRLLGD